MYFIFKNNSLKKSKCMMYSVKFLTFDLKNIILMFIIIKVNNASREYMVYKKNNIGYVVLFLLLVVHMHKMLSMENTPTNQLTIEINDQMDLKNSDKQSIEKELQLTITFLRSLSSGKAESSITIQNVDLLFKVHECPLHLMEGQIFYSLSPTMKALDKMSILSREARFFVKKIYLSILANPDHLGVVTKNLSVNNKQYIYQEHHSLQNFNNAFNGFLDQDKNTIGNSLSNNILQSLIFIIFFIEGAGLLSGTSADAHQCVLLTILLGFSCAYMCHK